MIALIDSDIVAFRAAATVPDREAEDIAILRCDKTMQDILDATESDQYKSFVTGPGNFRKHINPEYKANRKDKEPPIHLQACREFLINEWNTEVCEGYEADDALGINQTIGNSVHHSMLLEGQNCSPATVICTIDKDLDMIPGLHFNWVKGEIYEVSEIEALKFFYKQLLIGDKSDNIVGVVGIGKVKASKLIDHLKTEEEMLEVVKSFYIGDEERFLINAQCLWIWRYKNNIWQPPEFRSENHSSLEKVVL